MIRRDARALPLAVFVFALPACPPNVGDRPPPDQDCPEGSGPTAHSGTIDADQSWSAEDSPHVVTGMLLVRGATLTIEACAVVQFAPDGGLEIGDAPGTPEARLVARGEDNKPIRFEPQTGGGRWRGVYVDTSGRADLAELTIDSAGDVTIDSDPGALEIVGDDNQEGPVAMVSAQTVTITNAGAYGVRMASCGGFTATSSDLVITGSGAQAPTGALDTTFAVFAEPANVETLPTGDYQENDNARVFVSSRYGVGTSVTFHDRAVPYVIETSLDVEPFDSEANGGLATLNIDAGVEIQLSGGSDGFITLGGGTGNTPEQVWPTRVVAPGTVDNPILITSANETRLPGDWGGIDWGGGPQLGNVWSFVTVEYAGAPSGSNGFGCGPAANDALLAVRNWLPQGSFITMSSFLSSAGGGIVQGWSGTGSLLGPGVSVDGVGNNCEVSLPRDVDGQCPGMDSQPDCEDK